MGVRLKFPPALDPQISGLADNKRLEISIRAMVEFSESGRFLACQVFGHGDLGRSGMAKLMGNTFIDERQSSQRQQWGKVGRAERQCPAILPNGAALTALWIVCGAGA